LPCEPKLDASDLFVLPSRVKGLPRAMVEAMTRGLPCIGTFSAACRSCCPEKPRASPTQARLALSTSSRSDVPLVIQMRSMRGVTSTTCHLVLLSIWPSDNEVWHDA